MSLQNNYFHLNNTRDIGSATEQLASQFLSENGLKILYRNFQCKLGEIDLIALQNHTLLFIEVRYRKNTRFGTPAESVTYGKQRKIIRVARYFLMKNKKFSELPCRFDVIAITIKGDKQNIEWIQHAFY